MRSTTPVLVTTLVLAGCGSSGKPPTSPALTPPQIDFTAGLKLVTLEGENGDSLTSTPCGGVGVPAGGAILMSTRVDLEPDSTDWVARSIASTDGDLVLALHVTTGAQPNDRIVSGIATGTALTFAGRRMRATFSTVSASIISAGGNMIGTSVEGWIAGPVTFISSTGTTIICDEAMWTMTPLPSVLAATQLPAIPSYIPASLSPNSPLRSTSNAPRPTQHEARRMRPELLRRPTA